MAEYKATVARSESVLATNKVLRNTYALLGMALLVSAVAAMISMSIGLGRGLSLVMMIGGILIAMFVLPRTANSAAGVPVMFLFTAMLGMSIGPMLTYYLSLPAGPSIVAQALVGTAAIFLGLSFVALTTKKDFSFLGGFLMIGFMVVLLAVLANLFFNIPGLHLAISAAVVLLMSLWILFDTSRIINGGETNYIMAAAGMFINIFNLFVHLLHLVGALSRD